MTPIEQLQAQRDALLVQIAAIDDLGTNATPSQLSLRKMFKRQVLSINAQIIVLVNTPVPEEPPI